MPQFLFGDLTSSLVDKLGRIVPPILRLRESDSYQAAAILPGSTVTFDRVFATVIYDDGYDARIEAIGGESFAFRTMLGGFAYVKAIEVDSQELRDQNANAKTTRIVQRPMTDSIRGRLHDGSNPSSPPGALPGEVRQLW